MAKVSGVVLYAEASQPSPRVPEPARDRHRLSDLGHSKGGYQCSARISHCIARRVGSGAWSLAYIWMRSFLGSYIGRRDRAAG